MERSGYPREAVGMVFQAGEQQRHKPAGGEELGTFGDQRRGQRGWGAEATDRRSKACLPVRLPICKGPLISLQRRETPIT